MNPAFSVIFLTTLIGVGQGMFIALFSGQYYTMLQNLPAQSGSFYGAGSMIALVFLVGGLIASFFHLGHPERAWRAATQWRTSWLSREVIVLPIFMFFVFLFGMLHYFDYDPKVLGTAAFPEFGLTLVVGAIGVVVCFALFACTAMIYACLKFLLEWHTPLTVANYTLLGMASGFTLATVFASQQNSTLLGFFGDWSVILTLVAFFFRAASLIRNYRLKHKTTVQTAIGMRHAQIQQKSQGSMGGSFNTREFFHGKTATFFKSIKWIFLITVFAIPVALVLIGLYGNAHDLFVVAFLVQYFGLIAERWFFFAQARHPQNLYYQTV
ncbi:dimethyl sulfoxide reductase anchor subunit family protein [Kaarinaea lacus]